MSGTACIRVQSLYSNMTDKIRIALISDTHTKHWDLVIPECDLLICAGDVTRKGSVTDFDSFTLWFAAQSPADKVFVAGNHDFCCQTRNVVMPAGVTYLNSSMVTNLKCGLTVWGTPWTPYFYDWAFNGTDALAGDSQGPNLNEEFAKCPEGVDILVSHGPPYGILDTNLEGGRCGSRMLLDHVRRIKPKLAVFGHIHEARGMHQKDSTLYVNASTLDRSYTKVRQPIEVTFDRATGQVS